MIIIITILTLKEEGEECCPEVMIGEDEADKATRCMCEGELLNYVMLNFGRGEKYKNTKSTS